MSISKSLWNAEKAKVEKLNNKLIDMTKKLQHQKRLNKVLAEGIERHITKKMNDERSDT